MTDIIFEDKDGSIVALYIRDGKNKVVFVSARRSAYVREYNPDIDIDLKAFLLKTLISKR